MTERHTIAVDCTDDALRAWLEAWVAAMRLGLPAPVQLVVRVSDQPIPDGDQRTPFLQPTVAIRAGPPVQDVTIRWRIGPAYAVIAAGGTRAEVVLGRDALSVLDRLGRSFLTTVLIFLLRRVGWHHCHAAIARDPRGRTWLFAGNAQAGKSTTAARLATLGWGVGSDDITFLALEGATVAAVAQRAPITLRPGGHDLLGLTGGAVVREGRKMAYFPEEIGGQWLGRITPDIIALPRIEGGLTRVERVRPREALAELIRWSAWVALEPELAQDHLDLLTTLARQAACYRVLLGPDLFADRDLLMELVP